MKIEVTADTEAFEVVPRFTTATGKCDAFALRVLNNDGQELDCAVISVNGRGKLMLAHRVGSVTAVADMPNYVGHKDTADV